MKNNIEKITEFIGGKHCGLSDTHYTVYYKSGRRVNYYGTDNLPMSIVDYLTDNNTISVTTYIDDDYMKCINKRITYKATI